MDDSKSIWLSKTFWGIALTVLALVLKKFNIDLGDTSGLATDLVGLIGAGLALFGRIKATTKIG